MAHITCEGCNRWLDEADGPLCADCAAERRSEAAKTAAEARWEKEHVKPEEPESA